MTTATIVTQLEYSVDDEQFDAIIESAKAVAEIWAELSIEETDDEKLFARVVVEPGSADAEERILFQGEIEQAIKLILEKSVRVSGLIYDDILSAIIDEEPDLVDAVSADAIIQIACFNEIIYG